MRQNSLLSKKSTGTVEDTGRPRAHLDSLACTPASPKEHPKERPSSQSLIGNLTRPSNKPCTHMLACVCVCARQHIVYAALFRRPQSTNQLFSMFLLFSSPCGRIDFHSPNSVSTLRGSYGKRKGLGARLRCPLWPRAFCVVFTADSCSCLMSKCVSTAQARTK